MIQIPNEYISKNEEKFTYISVFSSVIKISLNNHGHKLNVIDM